MFRLFNSSKTPQVMTVYPLPLAGAANKILGRGLSLFVMVSH